MASAYDTKSGLPLPSNSTLSDLASALGLDLWQLMRIAHDHGRSPPEATAALTRFNVDGLLAPLGLAPVPETTDLDPPCSLDLGFVALVLDDDARALETRLETLDHERFERRDIHFTITVQIEGYEPEPFPGDGSRQLEDSEVQALAHDAGVDFDKQLALIRKNPAAAYARMETAMERVRQAFERGERSRPVNRMPSLQELLTTPAEQVPVYGEEGFEEYDHIPWQAMSPGELLRYVASGNGYPKLLYERFTRPEWDELVEVAVERHAINAGYSAVAPPPPERFHSEQYGDENRWKWVVRALRNPDTVNLARVVWLDEDLAELVLAHDHEDAILTLAAHAHSFDPPLRLELLDAALPLVTETPRRGHEAVAHALVRHHGTELGLRFVDLSLETKVDALAVGAAWAWTGGDDPLYWALRDYPREKVRRALPCLTGQGLHHGETMLDSKLQGEDRDRFRTEVVPVLLLDRSREVRRRARLAGTLSRLPVGLVVSFTNPLFRVFEAFEDQIRQNPGFHDSMFPSLPQDLSDLERRLRDAAFEPDQYSNALIDDALDVITDASAHPFHRDLLQYRLLDQPQSLDPFLSRVVDRTVRARDIHLAVGALEARDVDVASLRHLHEAWPEEPAVLGAVLASKGSLKDEGFLDRFSANSNPHVLYALARARLGVAYSRRAFRALVEVDADRALRVVENATRGTTIPVEPEDWSRIVAHEDPEIRLRALNLVEDSALRLIQA